MTDNNNPNQPAPDEGKTKQEAARRQRKAYTIVGGLTEQELYEYFEMGADLSGDEKKIAPANIAPRPEDNSPQAPVSTGLAGLLGSNNRGDHSGLSGLNALLQDDGVKPGANQSPAQAVPQQGAQAPPQSPNAQLSQWSRPGDSQQAAAAPPQPAPPVIPANRQAPSPYAPPQPAAPHSAPSPPAAYGEETPAPAPRARVPFPQDSLGPLTLPPAQAPTWPAREEPQHAAQQAAPLPHAAAPQAPPLPQTGQAPPASPPSRPQPVAPQVPPTARTPETPPSSPPQLPPQALPPQMPPLPQMESPYKLPVSQVSDHVPTRLQPGNITDAPSFSLAEEVPTPWARQDDGLSSTYRHDCGELSIPDFVKVASQEERPQVAQLRASSQKRSLGDKLSDFFKDIAFAFKRLFS